MTNSAKYYIWLTLALGYSSPKPKAIRELYNSIEEFYNGGEHEWRLSGVLKQKDIDALRSTPLTKALEVIARCNSLGITVLSFDDVDYPEKLYEIYDPPAVLYVKGKLPDFSSRLTIAMVGTRKATAYGKMTSHLISGSLAKVGAIIVSGGAVGIDSLSHTGAMEAGGTTVCVLGCGINYPYLMENQKMRNDIAATGALISAYPPDYPSGKYTFPERNRIISGLSDGVVVVEAPEKSGTRLFVTEAAEQGKDVFAVPGNADAETAAGTLNLLKEGAKLVTCGVDVLEEYVLRFPELKNNLNRENSSDHKKTVPVSGEPDGTYNSGNVSAVSAASAPEDLRNQLQNLSADQLALIAAISPPATHVDDIVERSGLPVAKVLAQLTVLEIKGFVKREPGRNFSLNLK